MSAFAVTDWVFYGSDSMPCYVTGDIVFELDFRACYTIFWTLNTSMFSVIHVNCTAFPSLSGYELIWMMVILTWYIWRVAKPVNPSTQAVYPVCTGARLLLVGLPPRFGEAACYLAMTTGSTGGAPLVTDPTAFDTPQGSRVPVRMIEVCYEWRMVRQ